MDSILDQVQIYHFTYILSGVLVVTSPLHWQSVGVLDYFVFEDTSFCAEVPFASNLVPQTVVSLRVRVAPCQLFLLRLLIVGLLVPIV